MSEAYQILVLIGAVFVLLIAGGMGIATIVKIVYEIVQKRKGNKNDSNNV